MSANVERDLRQLWLILLICIPFVVPAQAQPDDSASDIVHVVVAGESLYSISLAYGLTIDDIASTNGLDPEAFLQVGQRLGIIFPGEGATAEPQPTTITPEVTEDANDDLQQTVSVAALAKDLPSAPVTTAAVPMQDHSMLDTEICFALFHDDNRNGAKDPGEGVLAGGALATREDSTDDTLSHPAENSAKLSCIDDLQRQIYFVSARAPDGYGFTGPSALRVDLRDGSRIRLYFAVRPGADAEAPPTAPPLAGSEAEIVEVPESLLKELSGLFVLALAGIVLVSGMMAALLMRLR